MLMDCERGGGWLDGWKSQTTSALLHTYVVDLFFSSFLFLMSYTAVYMGPLISRPGYVFAR
jgi:hypothetical protein